MIRRGYRHRYSPPNASRIASDTGREIVLSVARVTSVTDPEARWAPAVRPAPSMLVPAPNEPPADSVAAEPWQIDPIGLTEVRAKTPSLVVPA